MNTKEETDLKDYIYNNTKIYKNNYPIDIDIDSLSEELFMSANNRASFEEIMKRIDNDILTSEVTKKSKKEEKIPKANAYYSVNDLYNGNKFVFRSTLPEGELIKEPIYQSSILHKKYTDVNANSKYYYPQKDTSIMGEQNNFKAQWTNRANQILLESQSNWANKITSPKSGSGMSPKYTSPH